jgi:hypothetical protein
MSATAARRILWLALLFCVPFPYWGIEVERGPAARLFLLTIMTGAVVVTEGGHDASIVGSIFVLQSLLALALSWVLAGLIVRTLPAARRGTAVAVLIAALVVLALQNVFHLPFARTGPQANLLGIFR